MESTDAMESAPSAVKVEPSGVVLEDFLPPSAPTVTALQPVAALTAAPAPAFSMRTARVMRVEGRRATLVVRGMNDEVEAEIAPEVEAEVIEAVRANGEAVLVEVGEEGAPVIVAALHTRRPREFRLSAETITIEAARELLLRAGRGAVRIREDGDVEIVGTRISAASRGLFRIVGRILRLN